jgi:soluble lytic murein transglycosylase
VASGESGTTAGVQASADAAASSAPAEPLAWAEAIRVEKWDEAWRGLEALSDGEKARPDVRYARARTALARGDAASAVSALDGLESQLPLLAEDIAHHRAEARLVVGPYAEAGDWFAARQSAHAQLQAAEAYEKAKDAPRARAACARVIGTQHRTREEEAAARAMRLRLVEKPGPEELADARWLVVSAADLPEARGVDLSKTDPSHPLRATELMTRAEALGDGGMIDEALQAIDDAQNAPGPPVAYLARLRAKGYLLYNHGRYPEASKTLAEAALAGGADAPQDAFHSARALSRADKDTEAIAGYTAVAAKWPRSKWGEKAAYFVPYLHLLHAEWKDAERGFDEYVKKYPDGSEKDAGRNRAISHLMTKDYKTARALFEKLSGEEPDALTSARLANMAALASLGDGDRTHALARWAEVARTRPLSYAALVARARLAKEGATIPPAIDPAEVGQSPGPLAVALPPPADLLHRIGLDADAENALHDRESLVTAGAGARAVEALCSAYGQLGTARRRYRVSLEMPATLLQDAPGSRNTWAWDCAYPSPYESFVRDVEAKEGLTRGLVYAVMKQESAYDPDAVSPKNAVGLLQLLPETGRTLADELHMPQDDARLTSPPYNIALGAHYLKALLDRFHGQLPLAIGAYNCGPEAIARWASRAPSLDLDVYVERIPYKETRDYVGRVMGNLARYAYMAGGESALPALSLALGQ